MYFQYSAMFSFGEIMVVCGNHPLLLYSRSANMLPHLIFSSGKAIVITLHNKLSQISYL